MPTAFAIRQPRIVFPITSSSSALEPRPWACPAAQNEVKEEDDRPLAERLADKTVWRRWCVDVIDPTELWKRRWDSFIMLLVLYTSVMTPFQLSFGKVEGLSLVELVFDVFFLTDVALYFRTAYEDADSPGKFISDPKLIARQYGRGWFIFDFVGSMPVELLFMTVIKLKEDHEMATYASLDDTWWVQFVHIFRLFRLGRLWKVMQKLEKTPLHRMIRLSLMILLLAHWFACVFHLVPVLEERYGYMADDSYLVNSDTGNWLLDHSLQNTSVAFRYITSLYWAFTTISTVGYGDITPVSLAERIMGICITFVGALLYSMIVANVTNIITSLNARENQFRENMEIFNVYLRDVGANERLKERVIGYFEFLRTRHGTDLAGANLMDQLPTPLQAEILEVAYKKLFNRNPITRNMSTDFIRDLSLRLTQRIVLPEEWVYEAKGAADTMFFLREGYVAMVNPDMHFKMDHATAEDATVDAALISWIMDIHQDTNAQIAQQYISRMQHDMVNLMQVGFRGLGHLVQGVLHTDRPATNPTPAATASTTSRSGGSSGSASGRSGRVMIFAEEGAPSPQPSPEPSTPTVPMEDTRTDAEKAGATAAALMMRLRGSKKHSRRPHTSGDPITSEVFGGLERVAGARTNSGVLNGTAVVLSWRSDGTFFGDESVLSCDPRAAIEALREAEDSMIESGTVGRTMATLGTRTSMDGLMGMGSAKAQFISTRAKPVRESGSYIVSALSCTFSEIYSIPSDAMKDVLSRYLQENVLFQTVSRARRECLLQKVPHDNNKLVHYVISHRNDLLQRLMTNVAAHEALQAAEAARVAADAKGGTGREAGGAPSAAAASATGSTAAPGSAAVTESGAAAGRRRLSVDASAGGVPSGSATLTPSEAARGRAASQLHGSPHLAPTEAAERQESRFLPPPLPTMRGVGARSLGAHQAAGLGGAATVGSAATVVAHDPLIAETLSSLAESNDKTQGTVEALMERVGTLESVIRELVGALRTAGTAGGAVAASTVAAPVVSQGSGDVGAVRGSTAPAEPAAGGASDGWGLEPQTGEGGGASGGRSDDGFGNDGDVFESLS